jgi:hypothetical protein
LWEKEVAVREKSILNEASRVKIETFIACYKSALSHPEGKDEKGEE